MSRLGWIKVECNLNFDLITNIIKIDNNRFGVIPLQAYTNNGYPDDRHIVYQYDTNFSEWNSLLTYSKKIKCRLSAIEWNSKTQQIWVIGDKDHAKSDIIEINTNGDTDNNVNIIPQKWIYIGERPNILLINDEYHVIGGSDNKYHLIWNNKLKRFNVPTHYDPSPFATVKYQEGIYDQSTVHIKSKNILLMLGGFDYETQTLFHSIYCYFINEDKWELLNTKLPQAMSAFGCILTNDEKYIIVFGGNICTEPDYIYSNNIYVMDIDTMNFKLSNIKCPEMEYKYSSAYYAILMNESMSNNELLIFGFIRQIYTMLISKDIIILIIKWVNINWIHLLETRGCSHWKISENDILNSL